MTLHRAVSGEPFRLLHLSRVLQPVKKTSWLGFEMFLCTSHCSNNSVKLLKEVIKCVLSALEVEITSSRNVCM